MLDRCAEYADVCKIACQQPKACMLYCIQVEVSLVDQPQLITFKGSFKLAAEPRGGPRSAAQAAAETVLVRPGVPAYPTLGLLPVCTSRFSVTQLHALSSCP